MSQVLVIDDDAGIRELLTDVLEEAGHSVLCASDGVKGSKLFTAHGADVVITDVLMPEKEGCSVIVDVREVSADAKIIAMSGGHYNSADAYLQLAQEVGADRVLAKPFEPSQLVTMVEELLSGQRQS